MAETDDGLTPKIGLSGNLDAKTFFWGKRMLWEKNITRNFSIVSVICLFMMLLYLIGAEAISALVLKFENRFIHTHPTLQRLFYELPIIKILKLKI